MYTSIHYLDLYIDERKTFCRRPKDDPDSFLTSGVEPTVHWVVGLKGWYSVHNRLGGSVF